MKNKPRIAILSDFPIGKVCDRYAERTRFYPTWLYNLFIAFSQSEDFEIHWIFIDKIIKKADTFCVNNQVFHVLPGTGLLFGLWTAYLYNRYMVARLVRKIKPDIFHGWGTERFYGLAAKDYKGKSLLSVQGLLGAYAQRGQISKFEQKQKWYEAGVLRSVRYISTESPWARDRVLEVAPGSDITLCEYAVEERFFNIERYLSETPSCLLASTNTPLKNIGLAVAAFSRPELRHVKLYLAGVRPGSFGDLPENIIPLGSVDRDKMVSLMSSTWALVHPSLADTGPTVVKEARVAGVPVVLTHDCGSKQHVVDGKSGYVIPPHDEQALVDAVLKLTESREKSMLMGDYGKEAVRKALSIETMCHSFTRLYNRILAE